MGKSTHRALTQSSNGLFKSGWVRLIFFLPPLILLVIIILGSVNTPFWDQWELVPIIEHIKAGHFIFNDFWLQHNEHRLLFPQLLMVGAALITHWNTRVECVIGFVIALSSFFLLLRVLKLTSRGSLLTTKVTALLVGCLSLIWFSPVQMENWLWGWQIQWFLNVLGIMFVIFATARIISSKAFSISNLIILLMGGILAQYSLGNGTLIWPIAVIGLWYLRLSWRKITAVAVTAIITTWLYFRHYANPSAASQKLTTHHPALAAHYFLIYLGRPLTFINHLMVFTGAGLLIIFIALVAIIWHRDRRLFKVLLPWVMLGVYAIGTAFITTFARLSFGLTEASSSRYTTMSSLLIISLLGIVFLARKPTRQVLRTSYRAAAIISIGGLIILILGNWAWGIRNATQTHEQRVSIKECAQANVPTKACLLMTYPNTNIVGPRLDYLKKIHWAGY